MIAITLDNEQQRAVLDALRNRAIDLRNMGSDRQSLMLFGVVEKIEKARLES